MTNTLFSIQKIVRIGTTVPIPDSAELPVNPIHLSASPFCVGLYR